MPKSKIPTMFIHDAVGRPIRIGRPPLPATEDEALTLLQSLTTSGLQVRSSQGGPGFMAGWSQRAEVAVELVPVTTYARARLFTYLVAKGWSELLHTLIVNGSTLAAAEQLVARTEKSTAELNARLEKFEAASSPAEPAKPAAPPPGPPAAAAPHWVLATPERMGLGPGPAKP